MFFLFVPIRLRFILPARFNDFDAQVCIACSEPMTTEIQEFAIVQPAEAFLERHGYLSRRAKL